MSKSLAITVLTWNDWKNTVKCLESIYQSTYNNFDIVLVNNNSDKLHLDQIKEWAKNNVEVLDPEINFNPNKIIEIINVKNKIRKIDKGKKKIYLIDSKDKKKERWAVNLGCTAGINLGYKFSLDQGYEYIARIDCDFIITKNYLEEMTKIFENDEDIIAASPKIIHGGMRDTIWWHGFHLPWGYLKFHRLRNIKKKRVFDNETFSGIKDTDLVTGCCSMYKSNSLKLSGLGDEDFFFGPECVDLSLRLRKFGKLVANLNAKTFHTLTQSSKVSGWLSRSYYEAKGFLILIKKRGDFFDKVIGYSYFLMRIPYYLFLLFLGKREKDRVFGYCLGCYDFFKKL